MQPKISAGPLSPFSSYGRERYKLILTSREYPEDIQESFSKPIKNNLWARDGDIASYITQKINDYPRVRRLVENGNYQKMLISQITECAHGMFLVVHFHIEYLCSQTTLRGFRQELQRLKTSFNEASPLNPIYGRAMDIIKNQPKTRVDLAPKVLSLRQIQMAVSMEEGTTNFDDRRICQKYRPY
ncbi:hypothetical protein P167DRAFT_565918 [Morchella conica CCBAS932]|uniref:Uncharacterized protein n=1 Tax=Morchella conica CCBAS932 TaxID=1392247 RepID=A0A3N4KPV0_9PEZI|nr:hypothetical protein P167DRAFT_565918 [Morchella conica CCBAS932]